MKTCETCKHIVFFLNCGKKPKGLDPIGGKMKHESCSIERDYPNFMWWRCGKKGRFWDSDDNENYISVVNKKQEEIVDLLNGIAEEQRQRIMEREEGKRTLQ